MSSLSALRSTFEGDPDDFASALATLRGDLSSALSDLSAATASLAPSTESPPTTNASVILNGPISIYGVQDVESLYDQLTAEARRRNV